MGRAHLARRRIDSYKNRIQACENYKKQFVNYLQDLKNKCLNREISYEEYKQLASKKQADKTSEEWIHYYDNYILECKKIIETERTIIKKSNIISSLTSFFFISLFILLFATQGGKIIGFAIQDSSQEYSEELNLHFENSSSYNWNPKTEGQLISLQVSGKILGEGSAKIYLDNILILDSNSIQTENTKSLLTGFSIQTGYTPESTDNTQTKEKEADSSEEEVSPSPSEPASAPNEIINLNETEENDTIELNQTEEDNTIKLNETEEKLDKIKLERKFIKHCENSCNLKDLLLDYKSYPLKIELNNAEIEISSITYTIIPFENESSNNDTSELNNTLNLKNPIELNQTEENTTIILNETQILVNISQLKILKEIPDFKVSKNSSLEINLEEYFENANNYSLLTDNLEHFLNNHNLSINISSVFTQEKVKIIAYSENESLESNEFNIISYENTINITKTRGKIRVGQPVKWTANISLNSIENLTITLPEEAKKIEVKEFNPQTEEISLSPITGNIIGNSNQNTNFIKRFLQRLRGALTGYAISDSITGEEKPETNIILEDNSKEYIIEYETEAPTSEEKNTLDGKEIVISAPDELHYTDVIASTNILDSEKITSSSQISLLWYNYEYDENISIKSTKEIEEKTILQKEELEISSIPYLNLELNFSENQENKKDYKLENMPFESYDLNGDGNLDYLEWVVPHLSNQTFTLLFSRENSTTPGNNISIEGIDGQQYSHLSTDKASSANQISDNLVAYYPFDKDDTTTSYDFANNYNGSFIANSVTNSTNCIINNCFHLNGAGDYISITDTPLSIDWGNLDWSTSVWARLDADAGTAVGIFTNRPGNANWVTLGYTSQSFIGVEINEGLQIDTNVNPAGTGWQHYVLVKNDSGLGLYINTTYYHLTDTPNSIGAPDTTVSIGDWFNGAQTWKGALDEVMFFNTSLNDTQVSQIYQNTSRRYVSSGQQETKFFNITSNVNQFNLSLQNYNRKFGTNISTRIGSWDISKGYNTSDLDTTKNGLIAYYNFDNRSSLGENQTFISDRNGLYNGTVIGGNGTNSDGVFSRSMQFDGINDYVETTDINSIDGIQKLSAFAWTKQNSLATDQGIIVKWDYATQANFGFQTGITNADELTLYLGTSLTDDGSGARIDTTEANRVAGQWHHVGFTFDGTQAVDSDKFRIYIDGKVTAAQETGVIPGVLQNSSATLKIGKFGGSWDKYFNGSIDEVMIFNRTLTNAEVNEIYFKGRALWTYSNYENITARNSNDNWSLNSFTISTSTTHILPSFLLVSDSNRFFTPILQATTTNPANATTDYIPDPAPTVTINFPLNTTYGTFNLPLMFNVSLNENGSVKYSLDNGLNNYSMINSSGGTLGTLFNRSNGSIASGSYVFRVYANDTAGNNNNTANITFNIDSVNPNSTFISPSPSSGGKSTSTVNLNVSTSDVETSKTYSFFNDSLVGWWRFDNRSDVGENLTHIYNWAGTGISNGTVIGGNTNIENGQFGKAMQFDGINDYINAGTSINLSNVSFAVSAWVNTANNASTQVFVSSYNGNVPRPFALQYVSSGTIQFQYNLNDYATSAGLPTNTWVHLVGVYNKDDGKIYLYKNGALSSDTAVSQVASPNRVVFIGAQDDGGPATFMNGSIDEVIIFNRSLELAEVQALYNSSQYYLQRSLAGLGSGSQTYNVEIIDRAGNRNTSSLTWTVDTVTPVVTITNPQPAIYNTSSLTFNVSLNENGSVLYSLDNGLTNYSMTGNESGTGFNATNSSIPDGTYNFKVYANDTAGNNNLTSNRTFYVDTTKPAISFIGDTPADASSQSATSIVVNVSSNGSLSGSSDSDHYVLTDFDNSLVGWWTMDDLNASSDPVDLTGINNGSAIGGASQNSSIGSGKFGKGFDLDGINDYIDAGDINSADGVQKLSVFAWVKQNALATDKGIVVKWDYATQANFGFQTGQASSDELSLFLGTSLTDDGGGDRVDTTDANRVAGQWHHVGFTFDGTESTASDRVKIYIDGRSATLSQGVGSNPSFLQNSSATLKIGKFGGSLDRYFNGSVDEVVVLNRTLSLAEIKSLYNASANKYYNNFAGLSISNHTFTSYAVDSAGNRNSTSRTVTISEESNTAPVITNVTIASTFSITENSFTSAKLNFTVYDADGFTDINFSNAKAQFNRTLETTRKDPACTNTANWSTNYANFSCTVNIWYFDGSGDWTVNASIGDLSSANAVNQTVLFTLGQTSAFVASPGNLTFGTLSRGASNQTASNDPLLLNNTGNKNITSGNVQINATDLIGETNAVYGIWAANISVGIFTGSSKECDVSVGANASSMNKSYFQAINQSILLVGNHSANDGSTGQEQLYFCIRTIGTENIGQSYSTNVTQGPWTIKILAVAFAFGSLSRKKKKIAKDKLVKALLIIKEEVRSEESSSKSEVIKIIFEEIQNKYSLTKQELSQIINEKDADSIPVSIFAKNLGGLEAVCKYLKENKGLSYVEIARLLNRDQRTIWTAYKKANKKLSIALEIKDDVPLLPISFIGNRNNTIIESSIIYLKEKGLKYVEIARLLNRDQRNIWTTYKKATENRGEKEYITSQ